MHATILVVEDEEPIQELLIFSLATTGFNLVFCESAEEADQTLDKIIPDLILLDWMLPGLSGYEFAKSLKAAARTAGIPIIMLTARSEENDRLLSLEGGAEDYITKPFSPRELVARIRMVLRRINPVKSGEPLLQDNLRLDPATLSVSSNGGEIFLPWNEFALLYLLLSFPDRVLSRKQLIGYVWGQDAGIDERTIDVYVRRLRRNLEGLPVALGIETVRTAGYRYLSHPRPGSGIS